MSSQQKAVKKVLTHGEKISSSVQKSASDGQFWLALFTSAKWTNIKAPELPRIKEKTLA
jgi:hypothetical protein